MAGLIYNDFGGDRRFCLLTIVILSSGVNPVEFLRTKNPLTIMISVEKRENMPTTAKVSTLLSSY